MSNTTKVPSSFLAMVLIMNCCEQLARWLHVAEIPEDTILLLVIMNSLAVLVVIISGTTANRKG